MIKTFRNSINLRKIIANNLREDSLPYVFWISSWYIRPGYYEELKGLGISIGYVFSLEWPWAIYLFPLPIILAILLTKLKRRFENPKLHEEIRKALHFIRFVTIPIAYIMEIIFTSGIFNLFDLGYTAIFTASVIITLLSFASIVRDITS